MHCLSLGLLCSFATDGSDQIESAVVDVVAAAVVVVVSLMT